MWVPDVVTERLVLRRYEPDDRAAFQALMADEAVTQHIGGVMTADAADTLFERFLVQDRGLIVWAATDAGNGAFVGHVGLKIRGIQDPPELIYQLAQPFWGKGLATEIGIAVLAFAFSEVGFGSVEASVDKDHPASHRVLSKIGMSFDRIGHDDEGEYLIYTADRSEWRAPA